MGNVASPLNTSGPFIITAGSGAFSLDSGATKTITVSFTPTDVGLFRDTIIITTNSDGANQKITIALSGTGYIVTGPHMIVMPTIVEFWYNAFRIAGDFDDGENY